MGYRVGIDVGGTFTDLVLARPDGTIVMDKTPTTLPNQADGVLTGLGQLAAGEGLSLTTFLGRTDVFVRS